LYLHVDRQLETDREGNQGLPKWS